MRRAGHAYDTGSRGVKWDVATPDVPPGKTRADVNDAIAAHDLYEAITAQAFVPYITNVDWNIRGWGYNVPPGW